MSVDLDSIDNQDFSEEIPASEGSVVWHLISQLKPGMSLSRITLPTFILESRSTIQRLTDWMVHADILRKIATEQDPAIRCLHMCTWLVSGFHMSPRTPKKPYNSLLGEVFRAVIKESNGDIGGTYVAEQVSHHPPISAFHYKDRKGNCIVWGHSEMRSKFYTNSIAALMDHENTQVNFECPALGETYRFNFPDMYGRGILVGKLVMEICGTVRVQCAQTGYTAEVVFEEKPWLRGRYNVVNGFVFGPEENGKRKKVIKLEGRWSAFLKATDLRNNNSWLAFDVRSAVPLTVEAPPLEEQNPYESQYAWQYVTKYLQMKDTKNATEHKLALEEKQRAERKYFEDNSINFELQRFRYDEETQRYVPLDLDLSPYQENEAQQQMPEPFHVPVNIQRAEEVGASKPMNQIHREAEERVLANQ